MIIGITGATGFVGRKLGARLISGGHKIRVLGIEPKSPFGREVDFTQGDLVSASGIEKFLKGVEVLIHLAARNLPPESAMLNDNVIATHNLVNAASKYPIKHILYTSSIAVYGNGNGRKAKESDPVFPNTEYGLTKYLAEEIIQCWGTVTGNPVTILRPFNMYGPGNYKGVIFDFYKSIRDTGKLTIYGDGKQRRDFLYIDDAINIIVKLVKSRTSGVFNLGYGKSYSVLALVKVLEKVINKKIDLKFDRAETAKVFNINYSLSKIKKTLNWRAKVALSEGIRWTIDWYEKNTSSDPF